jgi:hypothetical protein
MTKEALNLALEALEVANSCVDGYYIPRGKTHLPEIELAIIAIKEALANEALDKMAENARELGLDYEPPQEPVAWIWEKEDGYTSIETHRLNDEDMKNVGVKSMKPLYAKPQFIGLSEDEILLISADCAATHQHTDIHFAKTIEAKLKEKNCSL